MEKVVNLSMVSIVDSLLSTLHASANRIFALRPTHISLALAVRAVSLYSSRAAALVSRVLRLRRSTLSLTHMAN